MIHSSSGRAGLLFATSAVMMLFFTAWTSLAVGQGPLFAFDQECAEFWLGRREGTLWELMVFFTGLGSVPTLGMVTLMGALWQFSHGRRFFGTAWVLIVLGGGVMNTALKTNLDRPRPPEAWRDRAVLEQNQSYPSGHAMGSTIVYGMLCYALWRQTRFPLRRTGLVLFFLAFVAGIGFSRIYLRAHWFSDVIGGYTAGLAWLCLWVGWLERRRARRSQVAAVGPVSGPSHGGNETEDADKEEDAGQHPHDVDHVRQHGADR